MKKNTRKLLSLVCAALLLVCVTVGATFAYLTSQDTVINTFTVGNVKITMDEADVDENGNTPIDEEGNPMDLPRVKANEYKLMPGHFYTKDPTIHVDANSEDCWLFVKVDNPIADIEVGRADGDPDDAFRNIHQQLTEMFNWKLIDGDHNIYAHNEVHGKNADVPVFANFMIRGDVDNETLAKYKNNTIQITAYAVQADGFGTAEDAWTATFGTQFSH